MDDHREVLKPGDTLGDTGCVVRRLIGYGKYAQVYEAMERRMQDTSGGDARVAVKILHFEYAHNAEARQRLKREGDLQKYEVLGRHRNIVTVLKNGVHSYTDPSTKQTVQLPFLVMEYVEHITLYEYLEHYPDGVPVDATLITITRQLGNALAWIHTHSQNVVHRDLADHNILLRCERDARGALRLKSQDPGFVQITDFGLAFAHPATMITQNRKERIAANFLYASPEILKGAIPTAQDDLYSFGVLMYRLLTGQYPFSLEQADDLEDFAESVRDRPVSFPDTVPEPVQNCLIKAMEKQRKNRYASATEMTTALVAAFEEASPSPVAPASLNVPAVSRPLTGGPTSVTRVPPASGITYAATPAPPPSLSAPQPTGTPRKVPAGWLWKAGVILLVGVLAAGLLLAANNGWLHFPLAVSPTMQPSSASPAGSSDIPVMSPTSDPVPTLTTLQNTSLVDDWEQVGDLAFAYVNYVDGVAKITGRTRNETTFELLVFQGAGNVERPMWSPNGELLAYVSDAEGRSAVYVSDAFNTRRLSPPETTERWPTWRPDSLALVVSTETAEYAYLSLVDLASGQHAPLTGPYFNAWSPAWSPNGDYLAFVSDMEEGQDVYILTLNDLEHAPVNVSRTGDVLQDAPAWAPDGSWLVYATAGGLHWVSIENLTPGVPHIFTDNGQDHAPCFIGEREIIFQRTSGAGTDSIYQGQLGQETQQRVVERAAWPACRPLQ